MKDNVVLFNYKCIILIRRKFLKFSARSPLPLCLCPSVFPCSFLIILAGNETMSESSGNNSVIFSVCSNGHFVSPFLLLILKRMM